MIQNPAIQGGGGGSIREVAIDEFFTKENIETPGALGIVIEVPDSPFTFPFSYFTPTPVPFGSFGGMDLEVPLGLTDEIIVGYNIYAMRISTLEYGIEISFDSLDGQSMIYIDTSSRTCSGILVEDGTLVPHFYRIDL